MVSSHRVLARRPPRLYRLARLFARLSTVVLVLILVFLGTVAYSAVALLRQTPQAGGFSAGLVANGTLAVTGTVGVSNGGLYPVSGFALSVRVLNSSGAYIGAVTSVRVDLPPGGTTSVPIALYLPIGASGPAESLLVTNQVLSVGVWGNATFAYLFPVSMNLEENRSWGAPFANLLVRAGTPGTANGSYTVPVTVSFTDDAAVPDVGNLTIVVKDSVGSVCGGASYSLNVNPGTAYAQTQTLSLTSGCSPVGGTALLTFSGPSGTFVLPPEAIP